MNLLLYPGLTQQARHQFRLSQIHQDDDKIGIIAAEIYAQLNVDLSEASTRNNKREFVEARQIAMYIIWKHLKCTLKSIGAFFGGRDHSSVIHSRETVMDLMDTDNAFKAKVEAVEQKLFACVKK